MFCLITAQWFVLSNKHYRVHLVCVVHSVPPSPDTVLRNPVVQAVHFETLAFRLSKASRATHRKCLLTQITQKTKQTHKSERVSLSGEVVLLQPAGS